MTATPSTTETATRPTPATITKRAHTVEMHGLALPYVPTPGHLVGDRTMDGTLRLSYEQFDRRSIPGLPYSVPLVGIGHDDDKPIGRAHLSSTPDGVVMRARLVDIGPARDAVELVRADLVTGLSVSFTTSDEDQWTKGGYRQAPSVLRRNATLRHVALVGHAAYPTARVSGVNIGGHPVAPTTDPDDGDGIAPALRPMAENAQRQAHALAFLADNAAAIEARQAEEARAAAQAERDAAMPVWVWGTQMGGVTVVVDKARAATEHAADLVYDQLQRYSTVHPDPTDAAFLREAALLGIFFTGTATDARLIGPDRYHARVVFPPTYPRYGATA